MLCFLGSRTIYFFLACGVKSFLILLVFPEKGPGTARSVFYDFKCFHLLPVSEYFQEVGGIGKVF